MNSLSKLELPSIAIHGDRRDRAPSLSSSSSLSSATMAATTTSMSLSRRTSLCKSKNIPLEEYCLHFSPSSNGDCEDDDIESTCPRRKTWTPHNSNSTFTNNGSSSNTAAAFRALIPPFVPLSIQCMDSATEEDGEDVPVVIEKECIVAKFHHEPTTPQELNGERLPPSTSTTFTNGPTSRRVILLVTHLLLLTVAFSFGMLTDRYTLGHDSRLGQHTTVLDQELNDMRERIMLEQESLLVQLARSQLVSTSLSHADETNTLAHDGTGSNHENSSNRGSSLTGSASSPSKDHHPIDAEINIQDEMKSLTDHINLLKQQLNVTTQKLHEERKLREDAEQNVQEAWGHVQLFTSQAGAERRKVERDLRNLFRTMLAEQFGAGPHYVQLQLDMPDANGQGTSTLPHADAFLTIELATEQMPTSVLYFLRQVDSSLWDGRYFHYNDPHFLLTDLTMASDSIKFSESVSFARKILLSQRGDLERMTNLGLAHLPYGEYSKTIPHNSYTVGFRAGDGMKDRPGPAFFINKVDNTKDHAGQPCFGRVIIGQHVVDKLGLMIGPNDPNYVDPPVRIVSASILRDLREAVGGEDYLQKIRKDEI